ncbi:MAG: hydantoinase B/oxoprolinase family protein [Chloroflexota bacterium]
MTHQQVDSISIEVFRHRCTAVAEEMGVALGRSAFSPNIKERRDFSCAVFDTTGRMVAQAAHIPVHLGAMPRSVEAALSCYTLHPGDVVVLNDPYQGGTHLPDITTVAPVFHENECIGYTATRAHHADIGGITPGSMPMSRELFQEGLIIPPVKLVSAGVVNEALIEVICRNSRTGDERRGDLVAQLACHRVGGARLIELAEQHGKQWLSQHMEALLRYGERHMRTLLESIPDGVYVFEDCLDDDGLAHTPLVLHVSITVEHDAAIIDFGGTALQCRGPLNAPRAVAEAAVLYCFRCLAPADMPASAGAFTPLTIVIPEGTILNPHPPAPVAGGNVETSQRVVDVVFGALAQAVPECIPAASAGTMNNLTFGGVDPTSGASFAYYETLGGGMGARPTAPGLDGVQVHMTNTLNTPVEALERLLPVQIQQYALRTGSGGVGAQRGGDGLVRAILFLVPATLSLLTERRVTAPYGLNGGESGTQGFNTLTTSDGNTQILPSKTTVSVDRGTLLRLETPGGGGWGSRSSNVDE